MHVLSLRKHVLTSFPSACAPQPSSFRQDVSPSEKVVLVSSVFICGPVPQKVLVPALLLAAFVISLFKGCLRT